MMTKIKTFELSDDESDNSDSEEVSDFELSAESNEEE